MLNSLRRQAIQTARQYWDSQPVFLDTETTGLRGDSEIVEISIIDHAGEELYGSLVRPTRPIPPDAMRIHGITNDMVRSAPTWMQVWPEVNAVLQDKTVGIYNAEFDLKMMQASNRLYRLPWLSASSRFVCLMKLYSQFYGSSRWQTLEAAGRQCRIPLPNAHRARDDALLARALLVHMAQASA
jgi:DNA polymerase-3 subunit epsilon